MLKMFFIRANAGLCVNWIDRWCLKVLSITPPSSFQGTWSTFLYKYNTRDFFPSSFHQFAQKSLFDHLNSTMTAAVYLSMEIYFCQSVFVSQLQFLFGATKNVRTTKWPKVKKSTGLIKFLKPLYLRLRASIMTILNPILGLFLFRTLNVRTFFVAPPNWLFKRFGCVRWLGFAIGSIFCKFSQKVSECQKSGIVVSGFRTLVLSNAFNSSGGTYNKHLWIRNYRLYWLARLF